MDRRSGLVAALLMLSLLASAQTATKTRKAARPGAAHRASFTTVSRRKGATSTGAAHTAKGVAAKPVPAGSARRGSGRKGHTALRVKKAAAPSYQLHPDPERYQQIQQSLADHGFFKGQPDGNWNDDSVQALRDFQTANQLDPDGKISALTLMKLGLGPKHDGSGAPLSPAEAARAATSSTPEVPADAPLPPPPTDLPPETSTTPQL